MPPRWPENFLLRSAPRGLRQQILLWSDPVQGLLAHPRGDWLLSVLGEGGADRKQLVLATADCARLALPHAAPKEQPLLVSALDALAAWNEGTDPTRNLIAWIPKIAHCDRRQAPSQAAHATIAALTATTQPTAAHAAVRHAASAIARSHGHHSSEPWLRAFSETLARCGSLVHERQWRMHDPDPELLRCRPALQVAWDLANEHMTTDHLSTRQVLVAFTYRYPLEQALGKVKFREQDLLHPLSERIGASANPDALLLKIHSLLSKI